MLTQLEKVVLAQCLLDNHQKVNGCWTTKYENINGLAVHATSTNGTSGIGLYKRKRVYWWFNNTTGRFQIEPN